LLNLAKITYGMVTVTSKCFWLQTAG